MPNHGFLLIAMRRKPRSPSRQRFRASTLDGFDQMVADALHCAMFEGASQPAPLAFDRPFCDCFVDQEMKEGIVRR